MKLYKTSGLYLAGALLSTAALAASLVQTATLKDLQTVGTTSKKQKHQQYDLVFDTSTNEYICRTKLGRFVQADAVCGGFHAGVQSRRAKGRGKEPRRQQGEMRNRARGRSVCPSVSLSRL